MPGWPTTLKFRIRTAVAMAVAAVSVFAACVFETRKQDPAILIMGNSIMRNPPLPVIGWTGDWGMAATAPEKDYAHQLVRLLGEKGLDLELHLAERDCPDCDGAIDEQIHNMDQVRRVRPRYVVVQLAEHSGEIELRSGKMATQYRALLDSLRVAGVPRVYCVSSWGEKDPQGPHAAAMHTALMDFPAYRYVDISPVAADTLNYGDTALFANPGVRWHPGNTGMLKIAETLASAIRADK